MSDLAKEYEDRIEFKVLSARSEEGKAANERFDDFRGLKHGMVGLKLDGETAFVIPGHRYGVDVIRKEIDENLLK